MASTILPSSEYSNFFDNTPTDLEVEKAEMQVIEKYREKHSQDEPLTFDDYSNSIKLEGFAKDSNGDPDTSEMSDDLVRRLRIVISDVVKWNRKYEDREGLSSRSVGKESKSWKSNSKSLPSRLFTPLEKYDYTEGVQSFW